MSRVSIRNAATLVVHTEDWEHASEATLAEAAPWRTFRWRMGQQHFSGTYWSSTTLDHVVYESRLELGCLLLSDFDPGVKWIVAQPFLLETEVQGATRRHKPDYFLKTTRGPVVVDVKPKRKLSDPKIAFQLEWTKDLVQQRGWQYLVITEPDPVVLENVRFLAGYRRDRLFDPDLVDAVRAVSPTTHRFDEVIGLLAEADRPRLRAALFHLMWRGEFVADLTTPLGPSTLLRRTP